MNLSASYYSTLDESLRNDKDGDADSYSSYTFSQDMDGDSSYNDNPYNVPISTVASLTLPSKHHHHNPLSSPPCHRCACPISLTTTTPTEKIQSHFPLSCPQFQQWLPLLTSPAATSSLVLCIPPSVILLCLRQRIEECANRLGDGISTSAAGVLLREHDWNETTLYTAVTNDRTAGGNGVPDVATRSGARHRVAGGVVGDGDTVCRICFDDGGAADAMGMPCGHAYCRTCWRRYFETVMEDGAGDHTRIVCPHEGCREVVTECEIAEAAPDMMGWYDEGRLRSYVEHGAELRFCPGPDCDRVAVGGRDWACAKKVADCPACCTVFCFRCGEQPHGDETECTAGVPLSERPVERPIKECPKCSVRIEKNGGCNHMTCRPCGHEFCWICTGVYTRGHFCGRIGDDQRDFVFGEDWGQIRRIWIERQLGCVRYPRPGAAPTAEAGNEPTAVVGDEDGDGDVITDLPPRVFEEFEGFVHARRNHLRSLAADPIVDRSTTTPTAEDPPLPFDVDYVCHSLQKITDAGPIDNPTVDPPIHNLVSDVLRSKSAMDYFSHCHIRYLAHDQGQACVERRICTVAERDAGPVRLADNDGAEIPRGMDGDVRGDADGTLVRSRRFLKYAYAYVFFTHGERVVGAEEGKGEKGDNERGLFEDNREMLERQTELLSRELLLAEEEEKEEEEKEEEDLMERIVNRIAIVNKCMQNISQLLEFGARFLPCTIISDVEAAVGLSKAVPEDGRTEGRRKIILRDDVPCHLVNSTYADVLRSNK